MAGRDLRTAWAVDPRRLSTCAMVPRRTEKAVRSLRFARATREDGKGGSVENLDDKEGAVGAENKAADVDEAVVLAFVFVIIFKRDCSRMYSRDMAAPSVREIDGTFRPCRIAKGVVPEVVLAEAVFEASLLSKGSLSSSLTLDAAL